MVFSNKNKMEFKELNTGEKFKTSDVFFSKMIILLLLINPALYFVKLIHIQYLDVFLSSLMFLVLIIYNKKHFSGGMIRTDIVIIISFLLISSTISGFFYQDYLVNWLGIIYFLLFYSFPWYVLGRFTPNYECVLYYMKRYSLAITGICLAIYFHKISQGTLRTEEMGLSYGLLPATIISLYVFFTQKKPVHLFNIFLTLFLILSVGSRGPILCIIVYIALFLLVNLKRNIILATSITLLVVIVYINIDQILLSTIQFLNKYEISSRTLQKLLDGTITSGTGREDIHKLAFGLIGDHPISGVGIGVDRIKILSEVYAGTGRTGMLSSSYPHNLFIELLLQFGVIIGGILIGLILIIVLFSIFKGNRLEKNFIIIIISIGFVELMVSSSYILSQYFFYLLGVSYAVYIKKTKRSRYI